MRIQPYSILIISFAVLLIAAPLVLVSNASSSSPTQGYVVYQVTLQRGANQTNFVLNESSVPASQSGFVDLSFALTSSMQNLTYSHVVNASSFPEIFPFVPAGISGQSFSYQTHGTQINANVSSEGSAPISFNGASYSGSKYVIDLYASNSSSGQGMAVTGTIVTFPSGLLYSAQLQRSNGNTPAASVSVQLKSTNLQLDSSGSSSTTQVATVAGAGALGAAAFAIPYWKLRKRKNSVSTQDSSESKPSYWVD
jgi:hypothetical protein